MADDIHVQKKNKYSHGEHGSSARKNEVNMFLHKKTN